MTDEKKPPQGAGGSRLYAGVDVMADRLEVGIYAFEPFAKLVAALTLWGDPSQDEPWRLLHAQLCACPGLQAVGVDSGGHQTSQVYRFALESNRPESGATHQVFATKGRSTRRGGLGLSSMLVETRGLGGMLEERIKLLVLLVDVKDDPASPDVLRCALAVHDWIYSIPVSVPCMRLKPGHLTVPA